MVSIYISVPFWNFGNKMTRDLAFTLVRCLNSLRSQGGKLITTIIIKIVLKKKIRHREANLWRCRNREIPSQARKDCKFFIEFCQESLDTLEFSTFFLFCFETDLIWARQLHLPCYDQSSHLHPPIYLHGCMYVCI